MDQKNKYDILTIFLSALIIIVIIMIIYKCVKNPFKNILPKSNCECYEQSTDNLINYDLTNKTNPNYARNNARNGVPNAQTELPTLILFHTPWCGHSKNFMPIWIELLHSNLSKIINFKDYDCDKQPDSCNMYNITGYPSLILSYPNGQVIYFPNNLERNKETVTKFIYENIQNT